MAESPQWVLLTDNTRKGFRRAQTGTGPHIAADRQEDREGRSPLLLVSPQPLSSSTGGDWGGTQMTRGQGDPLW